MSLLPAVKREATMGSFLHFYLISGNPSRRLLTFCSLGATGRALSVSSIILRIVSPRHECHCSPTIVQDQDLRWSPKSTMRACFVAVIDPQARPLHRLIAGLTVARFACAAATASGRVEESDSKIHEARSRCRDFGGCGSTVRINQLWRGNAFH